MNIGVNLVGISAGIRSRDWTKTYSYIKNNVITCWENQDTYITTYEHSSVKELLYFYKPKKYQILDIEGSDQRLTYKKSLEMLLDQDLDFIISTRFDIQFYNPISSLDINFDKFNILFPENYPGDDFVCDNFFAFPKSHLTSFIHSIQYMYDNPARNDCTDLHATKKIITSKIEGKVHMISNVPEYSSTNSFYTLHRN